MSLTWLAMVFIVWWLLHIRQIQYEIPTTLSCWGHEPLLRRSSIYICCIDFGSLHLVDKYTMCFCCTFCQKCLLIFVFLDHSSQLTMIRTFHFVSHIGCCFHHSSPQWATLIIGHRLWAVHLSWWYQLLSGPKHCNKPLRYMDHLFLVKEVNQVKRVT